MTTCTYYDTVWLVDHRPSPSPSPPSYQRRATMEAATRERETILIDCDDGNSRGSNQGRDRRNNTPNNNDDASASRASDEMDLDRKEKDRWSSTAVSSSSSSAPLVAQHQRQINQRKPCNLLNESVIDLQEHSIDSPDKKSSSSSNNSSSSSSSSGIPSPWKSISHLAASSPGNRPPSIILTTSPLEKDEVLLLKLSSRAMTNTNRKTTKKTLLANHKAAICNEISSACTDLKNEASTLSKRKGNHPMRRKGWNRKRGPTLATTSKPQNNNDVDSSLSMSSSTVAKSKPANVDNSDTANKHFHCYLLRSLDPDHPLTTYIGFTTHPERRIRQHNGILKNGGARRTKRSGRPWTFVCVVHGFEDKVTALQFEWAWQNVDKSKAFREALSGDDKLAKKMKRSLGPKARLEELRILLKECLPFCLYSLTVYFPERYYHDIFSGILRRGKNGNPYKKDDDESDALFEPLMNIEICSLENMPVSREAAQLKEKKKAKKSMKQQQMKSGVNYESEIFDWLEEENSCWSDMLDDDDVSVGDDDDDDADRDEDSSFLEPITETNLSIGQCDGGMESDTLIAVVHSHFKPNNNEMDDLSREFFSLSVDSPEKQTPMRKRLIKDARECDFSTISSENRSSSLDDEASISGAIREPERIERENQHINKHMNAYVRDKSIDIGLNHDVIDLCDSPL